LRVVAEVTHAGDATGLVGQAAALDSTPATIAANTRLTFDNEYAIDVWVRPTMAKRTWVPRGRTRRFPPRLVSAQQVDAIAVRASRALGLSVRVRHDEGDVVVDTEAKTLQLDRDVTPHSERARHRSGARVREGFFPNEGTRSIILAY
jgi:hypothetical protein